MSGFGLLPALCSGFIVAQGFGFIIHLTGAKTEDNFSRRGRGLRRGRVLFYGGGRS